MDESPMPWVEVNKSQPVPESFTQHANIDMDDTADSTKILETLTPVRQIKVVKRKVESPTSPQTMKILNTGLIRENSTVNKLPMVREKTQITKVGGESYTIRRISSTQQVKPKPPPVITKQEIIQPAQQFEVFDLPVQFEAEPAVVQVQAPLEENLKPILLDSLKQIAELKQIIQEKDTSTPARKEFSNISQSHLNKVQLFNGIKRYLSPSMVALLRIELFSNPNREYKKDEKIICRELLELGERTYDHLTDEWRLRLPAKSEVAKWPEGRMAEEEDDAC
jgi:hypothetical protein